MEGLSMRKRWTSIALLAAGLGFVVSVGCSKDLVPPDTTPPTGSDITNPPDHAQLNSQVINIRGRAEVGATVSVSVNDVLAGSAVSSPAVPYDGQLGRFTVEGVDLGAEGPKRITASVTDLYGNTAATPLEINVMLDMTAPPVALENIVGAIWDSLNGEWTSGLPFIVLVGRTDTTALARGARVWTGQLEFGVDSTKVFPAEPGQPDSMRFWIGMTPPPLTPSDPESLVNYVLETFDGAGNTSPEPFTIFWAAAGRETVLLWDDGDYHFFENQISGQQGMALAVGFQAPAWASFVTKIQYYIMNDSHTNPTNPTAPTTAPFTAWIWKTGTDGRPAGHANAGYTPFDWYSYPEDQWVEVTLPNAVDITDDALFPSKQFFAGLEWQFRDNPIIGYDTDSPIDERSYRWNWSEWEWFHNFDVMIRAVVSDLPTSGKSARTAVVTGRAVVVRQGR
jgi:hypothetical protein